MSLSTAAVYYDTVGDLHIIVLIATSPVWFPAIVTWVFG